jgi:hypothetical protein
MVCLRWLHVFVGCATIANLLSRPATFGKDDAIRVGEAAELACRLQRVVACRTRRHLARELQGVDGKRLPITPVGRPARFPAHVRHGTSPAHESSRCARCRSDRIATKNIPASAIAFPRLRQRGAATPTPVAKNRCADPACAATDRAPIRPILVSASSRKLEFFVPAGPRANNDRIKVRRPPLSGHTALLLRASSSQEAARSRHPRSRAFGASIAFANGADGTCKRDLGKWVDEQREAFPWP